MQQPKKASNTLSISREEIAPRSVRTDPRADPASATLPVAKPIGTMEPRSGSRAKEESSAPTARPLEADLEDIEFAALQADGVSWQLFNEVLAQAPNERAWDELLVERSSKTNRSDAYARRIDQLEALLEAKERRIVELEEALRGEHARTRTLADEVERLQCILMDLSKLG